MSLLFHVSPASDVPIYRQIIHHIRRALVQGQLEFGEQLPAVRTLAEALVVNPNTVARAYQELIRDGVLESRNGVGVFVAESTHQIFSEDERQRRLHSVLEPLLDEALLLGFSLPEIRAALEIQWKALPKRPPQKSP